MKCEQRKSKLRTNKKKKWKQGKAQTKKRDSQKGGGKRVKCEQRQRNLRALKKRGENGGKHTHKSMLMP